MEIWRVSGNGKEKRSAEILSHFLFQNLYINIKIVKSNIFLTFGGNYTKILLLLSTIQTSPNTFQFVQFSHSFLKFFSPIIPQYNYTFTPIRFREINRTNLHKISINTQIHLIYFYYHLHFDLRNHVRPLKLEGLTPIVFFYHS